MKSTAFPLLALGSRATAQVLPQVMIAEVMKISRDAVQGPFRPFVELDVDHQPMLGLLDTGSSDITVPEAGSHICDIELQQCDGRSRTGFVAGSLSPAHVGPEVHELDVPLTASFTGGAGFRGKFVEAPIEIGQGSEVITQFGLVRDGDVPRDTGLFPIVGIGPTAGESTVMNGEPEYPNFPARLKEENRIKSNVFSLCLGDFRSPENGSLIWGGVDEAKFDGDLIEAPMEPMAGGARPKFVVNMSSVRMTRLDGFSRGNATKANATDTNSTTTTSISSSTAKRATLQDTDDQASSPQPGPIRSAGGPRRRTVYPRPRPSVVRRAATRPLTAGNMLTDEMPPVAFIDSGEPYVTLPPGTAAQMADALGTHLDPNGDMGPVPCDGLDNMAMTVGFNDDAMLIDMRLDTMMLPPEQLRRARRSPSFHIGNRKAGKAGGKTSRSESSGEDTGGEANHDDTDTKDDDKDLAARQVDAGGCRLAIAAGETGPDAIPTIGAPGMQSMYIVFDNDRQSLMLAPARMNETRSAIREWISDAPF